ncbi:MAG: heat shock protein transcriptional repressor HspR [Dehalococcoidia bacterium]|tara:strand:- start:282 stop:638 length:357 start_codon:yes stop_codon:yes gene_type:complete
MVFQEQFKEEPCFVISIAARMVGVHAQTLRYYERVGLIWPSRSVGKQRLYSPADIERLRRIKELTEDLGVNLAGAEIILKLLKRIDELESKLNTTQETLTRLQDRVVRKPSANNQQGV